MNHRRKDWGRYSLNCKLPLLNNVLLKNFVSSGAAFYLEFEKKKEFRIRLQRQGGREFIPFIVEESKAGATHQKCNVTISG